MITLLDLPDDILLEIHANLPGTAIMACRQLWRTIYNRTPNVIRARLSESDKESRSLQQFELDIIRAEDLERKWRFAGSSKLSPRRQLTYTPASNRTVVLGRWLVCSVSLPVPDVTGTMMMSGIHWTDIATDERPNLDAPARWEFTLPGFLRENIYIDELAVDYNARLVYFFTWLKPSYFRPYGALDVVYFTIDEASHTVEKSTFQFSFLPLHHLLPYKGMPEFNYRFLGLVSTASEWDFDSSQEEIALDIIDLQTKTISSFILRTSLSRSRSYAFSERYIILSGRLASVGAQDVVEIFERPTGIDYDDLPSQSVLLYPTVIDNSLGWMRDCWFLSIPQPPAMSHYAAIGFNYDRDNYTTELCLLSYERPSEDWVVRMVGRRRIPGRVRELGDHQLIPSPVGSSYLLGLLQVQPSPTEWRKREGRTRGEREAALDHYSLWVDLSSLWYDAPQTERDDCFHLRGIDFSPEESDELFVFGFDPVGGVAFTGTNRRWIESQGIWDVVEKHVVFDF
ncbi:hypothetical protein NP233_g1920 [Leucocoprinus birnbaumii]|uniref:F-box domain-containing protein n=1 Tax=Leucocoprinus birnbaumii TaxID=56174 RepID=A0AAD5W361_9AGAR|nr:hypothetical protein NP233_g1920 [Leucocoprinus birnbaumii]